MKEATFVLATALATLLANIFTTRMSFIYDHFCKSACSNIETKTLFAISIIVFFIGAFLALFPILTKLIPQKFTK